MHRSPIETLEVRKGSVFTIHKCLHRPLALAVHVDNQLLENILWPLERPGIQTTLPVRNVVRNCVETFMNTTANILARAVLKASSAVQNVATPLLGSTLLETEKCFTLNVWILFHVPSVANRSPHQISLHSTNTTIQIVSLVQDAIANCRVLSMQETICRFAITVQMCLAALEPILANVLHAARS